jgi:hypothetical protein
MDFELVEVREDTPWLQTIQVTINGVEHVFFGPALVGSPDKVETVEVEVLEAVPLPVVLYFLDRLVNQEIRQKMQ